MSDETRLPQGPWGIEDEPALGVERHGIDSDDRVLFGARRTAAVLSVLAVVALAIAIVANALWLTQYGPVKRTFAEASKSSAVMATRYTPATLPELGKSSLSMLPPTVISYETITRQTVPGTDNTQSEGIYVSLNVDLQMQREIQSYARAEGYADENAAAARLAELALRYPVDGKQVFVAGSQNAYTGYTKDRGEWVVAWRQGSWVTWVKTFWPQGPPVDKKKFLVNTGSPVVNATVVFQRTGKSGVGAGSTIPTSPVE